MDTSDKDLVLKNGTFLYDGTAPCKVRIVQIDVLPGSGDYEDPPEVREDQSGVFFRIDYASPHSEDFKSIGGYFSSLQEAVDMVERTVQGLAWQDSGGQHPASANARPGGRSRRS